MLLLGAVDLPLTSATLLKDDVASMPTSPSRGTPSERRFL
jgi:hypothetical protein